MKSVVFGLLVVCICFLAIQECAATEVVPTFSVVYSSSKELGDLEVIIFKCTNLSKCETAFSAVSNHTTLGNNAVYYVSGLSVDSIRSKLYFALSIYKENLKNETVQVTVQIMSCNYTTPDECSDLTSIYEFDSTGYAPDVTFLSVDTTKGLAIFTNELTTYYCQVDDCAGTVTKFAIIDSYYSIIDWTYDPVFQHVYCLSLTLQGNAALWRLTLDGEQQFWQLNEDFGSVGIDNTGENPLVALGSEKHYITLLDLSTMKYTELVSAGNVERISLDTKNKMAYWASFVTVGNDAGPAYTLSAISYATPGSVISLNVSCGGEACDPTIVAVIN